jgi:hypothetical protein
MTGHGLIRRMFIGWEQVSNYFRSTPTLMTRH